MWDSKPSIFLPPQQELAGNLQLMDHISDLTSVNEIYRTQPQLFYD